LITGGRVTVNGATAILGQVVDPAHDTILVDGTRVVMPADAVWIVLHKPPGVLTTRSDPAGRPTVFQLVDDCPGLTYVGRLDYMTAGVLLLTTDGAAAHALTHPSHEIERTYVATVRGNALVAAKVARRGVLLDDGPVRPRGVAVHRLPEGGYAFEVTLTEGRNREVRRLCEALGLTVERLVRTQFGPVRLGALVSGASRPLTRREYDLLCNPSKGQGI
jgi:23S rRNA pseudouridine2605 synthase